MRAWIALMLVLVAMPASAVDVSQLSDFENDPCVIGLAERNTAQKIGAPDSALSDACERAHGSIEVGWDIILRTWKAPDVSRTTAVAGRPGLAATLIGLLGMLLATALLGWPVRAIRRVAQGAAGRFWIAAMLAVAGRLVVAIALLALLTLPYTPLLAAALVLWRVLRRPGRVTLSDGAADSAPASALAETLAEAINDVAANLPLLLGLALFARGNLAALIVGVLLAVPLSWPVFGRPWRGLRNAAALPAAAIGAVVMALAAGVALAAAPIAFPPALGVLIPLAFAAAVLWRPILGRGGVPRWRVLRRPAQRPPQLPGV